MTKKKRPTAPPAHDPNAEREAQKYDNPIPSREFILDYLDANGASLNREELSAGLELETEENLEALRRRLRAMVRDGQLLCDRRGRYAPTRRLDLVRGRVVGHPDGFGFLVPDEGGGDLFLSARQMRSIMHGDRVLAHVVGVDRRGRREGAVVEVLERNTQQVVGRFFEEAGVFTVAPENKRLVHDVIIPPEGRNGAQDGQIVVADIVEQPSQRGLPVGRVVEVLGDHMAPGMEIDVAIRASGLPNTWPAAVQAEIAELGPEVPEAAKQDRTDLRNVALVTIDGADARDFDDAVYCEPTPKGWRLLVAIADVSHYVAPGSALDQEARERGTSVYFPERVIPMLPEVLSNGLCSINPKVDRLCMVCEMLVDKEGKVTRSSFMEGVMRSHARLTYDQVAAMLVDGDAGLRSEFDPVVPHLENLYDLFKVLRRRRAKRGAIDFETTETRIVFGADRKIERIVPVQRNDAHLIIEECMILANVCAAKYLARHRIPTLYRVHDRPEAEKITELREFLGEFGLQLRGGAEPEPRHFAELLKKAQDRPDRHLIQTVMLRSLKQAKYTPDNNGHFGLAHEAYAHFTSPIRRYPDLLVHRAIRYVLRSGKQKPLVQRAIRRVLGGGKPADFLYDHEAMVMNGEHCSMTERRADEATRDAVSWLKCEFMMDKVGESFDGTIAAVTSFGIFVELDDIYVEGLVHVTALGEDYFHFDPVGHRMQGERTGRSYRLGDRVRVRVMRVDLDERKIDFELSGEPQKGGGQRGGGGKSKAKAKPRAKTKSKAKAKTKTKAEEPTAAQAPRKRRRRGGKKRTANKD
jgi:ribonuclease R